MTSLATLTPGAFLTLSKIKPVGSLQARKQGDGAVAFFWRYTHGARGASKSERVALGLWDPALPPKSLKPGRDGRMSVAGASRAAEELAQQHYEHRDEGGRPALLVAKRQAQAQQEAVRAEAAKYTLRELLRLYVAHLAAQGKPSHKQARSRFDCHVLRPWPELCDKPAREVAGEEFADVLRAMREKGIERVTNQVRSYLHAAYEVARNARRDPEIPSHFKGFTVSTNPVAEGTKRNKKLDKSAKNPLSIDELRAYWRVLRDTEGPKAAACRLHLLTGGQRIEQLVKARPDDYRSGSAPCLRLIDTKGRDAFPRDHIVPLIPEAERALAEARFEGGAYLFATDAETHIHATNLSKWACEFAADGGIEGFLAKRVRSGVETLLASVGWTDREMRGRLQSHGMGGVQDEHYDAYDYMREKRAMCEDILNAVEGRKRKAAKVVAIPQRRRA